MIKQKLKTALRHQKLEISIDMNIRREVIIGEKVVIVEAEREENVKIATVIATTSHKSDRDRK